MKRSLATALALLSILSITARAQSFDIKTHSLKNGMKILVQEDHSIPNATIYIFYRHA
jgi:zinc protease